MGIRMDQQMGLNAFADDLVHQLVKVVEKGIRFWPDGEEEEFDRGTWLSRTKTEVIGHYSGMFEDQYELHKYILPNGKVYKEYVQAEPWSSGPVFFLALTDEADKVVEKSLWSNEEVANV